MMDNLLLQVNSKQGERQTRFGTLARPRQIKSVECPTKQTNSQLYVKEIEIEVEEESAEDVDNEDADCEEDREEVISPSSLSVPQKVQFFAFIAHFEEGACNLYVVIWYYWVFLFIIWQRFGGPL